MIIILSPSKTLNINTPAIAQEWTHPEFIKEASELIRRLKKLSSIQLQELMSISPKLAMETADYLSRWQTPFSPVNAKQAIHTFKGEVYSGLKAESYSNEDLLFAQQHLIILSGLYGMLKPFDLIQPYRLEMGTKLSFDGHKNLYEFWREKLTEKMNILLQKQGNTLINLTSNEYFKVLNISKLNAKIITPEFKEYRNGTFKTITIYTKKARGALASFLIKNKITKSGHIKLFDEDGYYFNNDLSTNQSPVFTRG